MLALAGRSGYGGLCCAVRAMRNDTLLAPLSGASANRADMTVGYLIGACLMILGGLVGVNSWRKSIEGR
jgi:hypothetical protein